MKKKSYVLNKEDQEQAEWMAKILTIHGYRNSPIEDIHADGRISQKEMKNLNKTIHDQIYTILYLMFSGAPGFWDSWYFQSPSWGADWDKPKLLPWEKALKIGAKRGAKKERAKAKN